MPADRKWSKRMKQGSGSAIRYSTTVSHEMLYRAFYQSGAGQERIVRVAMPLKRGRKRDRVLFAGLILIGLLARLRLGLLLAWFFSRYLSRRFRRFVQFSEQVAQGSFSAEFFSAAAAATKSPCSNSAFNDMSLKIRDNSATGHRRKRKSRFDPALHDRRRLGARSQRPGVGDQRSGQSDVSRAAGTEISMASRCWKFRAIPKCTESWTEVLDFRFFRLAATPRKSSSTTSAGFASTPCDFATVRGSSFGSILVFHDVTDIKRFESMRSDFVANVSHELRTPLTAIRGYVETLLHTPPCDPADSRQFLDNHRPPLRAAEPPDRRSIDPIGPRIRQYSAGASAARRRTT